jgi:cathepsin B
MNSWRNWGKDGFGRVAVGDVGLGSTVHAAVMEPPRDAEVEDAATPS